MKKDFFTKSTILITGGSGSWGKELTRQLLQKYRPKEIRIYSRDEHKQVRMRREFDDKRLQYYIGDVRDKARLMLLTKGVDYVFHLAALKHVPVCEENPWEAVKTNIVGTQNVIEASLENNVKKMIDVSTDKAVDPFNLYGVTKACGEKLVIAANLSCERTKFVCVRGGNVIGTEGSVVPLFREQLRKLNEVTLTDEKMSRFFMRLEEAISLVLKATIDSVGGEVFVMKMPSAYITDLAQIMIKHLGNKKSKIKTIGIRPGEKVYEVLVSKYEIPRTYDFGKYYIILPQINIKDAFEFYKRQKLLKISFDEFSSQNTKILSIKEITELLKRDSWLSADLDDEATDYLKRLGRKKLENFFSSEGWRVYEK